MCYVDAYYKKNVSMPDDASSGGGKPMSSMSFREEPFSLGQTNKFIDN